LEDDKIYSEIPESQFYEEEDKQQNSRQSLVSEEAIRDEDQD